MSRFNDLLEQYCANMDRQKELDESLLCEAGRAEWIGKLRARSSEYEVINRNNNEIIKEVLEIINQPHDHETLIQYHCEMKQMYNNGYDEVELLIPICRKLLECGVSLNGDFILHNQLYFEESIIKASALNLKNSDVSHLEAALKYMEFYSELSVENRKSYWGCYFNYLIAVLEGEKSDPDTSCQRLREMLEFWESDIVQKLDGTNEEFLSLIDGIKMEWLGVQEYIETANEDTRAFFCELAEYYYERECKNLEKIEDYNNEIYAAYLIASIIRGEKDRDDAMREYFDYYEKRCEKLLNSDRMDLEVFYFFTNTPITLEHWCNYLNDEELKRKIINSLIGNTKKTWYNQKLGTVDAVLDSMLRNWCFTMTKYMNSQSEKIDWVLELVVRRQITTYLHSAMVRDLSEAIGREVMKKCPEYFKCVPAGIGAIEFVRNAALLHDIGKTSITSVITTQGRMLSDDEFKAIRQHPAAGYDFLDDDEDLKPYADIAIGHHMFYDGKGGYPGDFDLLGSPYKPIIDIITICDCLDAATDHLGRNYKKAKSFEEVMAEFEAGKGTRYSPVIVDIISESPRLKKELEYMVEDGRVDTMYKAYLQNVL